MHCKSRGQVVPSFGWTYGNSIVAGSDSGGANHFRARKHCNLVWRVSWFDFEKPGNVNAVRSSLSFRETAYGGGNSSRIQTAAVCVCSAHCSFSLLALRGRKLRSIGLGGSQVSRPPHHEDLFVGIPGPGAPSFFSVTHSRTSCYHTRQEFSGTMGCPLVQPKALPNSSKFCTVPLTRQRPGECGSVSARCRADCSVWFSHHTCANPRK